MMGLKLSTGNTTHIVSMLEQQVKDHQNTIDSLRHDINCLNTRSLIPIDQKILESIEKSKHKYEYEYIVFSGGGIKGISFIGALESLEKFDILSSCHETLMV